MFRANRSLSSDAFEAYRLAPRQDAYTRIYPLPKRVYVHSAQAGARLGYKELKAQAGYPVAAIVQNELSYVAEDGSLIHAAIGMDISFRVQDTPYANAGVFDGSQCMPTLSRMGDAWVLSGTGTSLLAMHGDTHAQVEVPGVEHDGEAMPWHVMHAQESYALLQRAVRHSPSTYFDVVCVSLSDDRAHILWHVTCDHPVTYALCNGPEALLAAETPVSLPTRDTPKPLPWYAWSQTPDDVSCSITLPLSVSKYDVRATFKPQGFSLSLCPPHARIYDHPPQSAEEHLLQGTMENCTLWASILADESTWSWETSPHNAKLVLHMTKAHSGTRWPSLLVNDDSVPETLDATDMAPMMDRLDPYTSSRLLQDGLEDEDFDMGTPWHLSYIDADGKVLHAQDQVSFLARSIPSSRDPAVLLKHDMDGHVFTPPSPISFSAWTHTETVPAISYVLASKRDAHPIYMYRGTSMTWIIAVEMRTSTSQSLVYVYGIGHNEAGPSTSGWCRIHPLEVGPVLDVMVIPSRHELVCLCESSLAIITHALLG